MNIRNIGVIIAVSAVILFLTAYTVDQRERAILFTFKEISQTDIQPGIHFRVPLVQTVKKFPSQILMLDANEDNFLTNEKKYVTVDFFVKWRIDDSAAYYRATRGGDIFVAMNRLEAIMKDGLRNEFSKRSIQEAISGERGEIMDALQQKSNETASQLGIQVVDVRVNKIDLPQDVSESVYQRMRTERQRVARDFRAKGQEAAERIKAAADREARVIVATAQRDAEIIRGQGDAKAAEIYASAYGGDAAEFYKLYRSLNAYREALGQGSDLMVLDPDSDFFSYFRELGEMKVRPEIPPRKEPTVDLPEPVELPPELITPAPDIESKPAETSSVSEPDESAPASAPAATTEVVPDTAVDVVAEPAPAKVEIDTVPVPAIDVAAPVASPAALEVGPVQVPTPVAAPTVVIEPEPAANDIPVLAPAVAPSANDLPAQN